MSSAGWTVCAKTTAVYLESVHPEQRGAFMAPEPDDDDDETWVLFNAMNGNRAEMSPEAAGIAACLMTYSHHACRTECYAMTVHYYRLRITPCSIRNAAPLCALLTERGRNNATDFLSAREKMTPGERSLIQRALKTLDRHLHEPGVAFTSTRAAREWLILNMAGLEREEFRVLYLNNQNQLIAGETLFTGTINRTEVHPREVIKRALYHNAAAVVLAHNHPSGEVTPSKADRLITERLVQALGLVDIRVPDHLIVGGSQVFSFAEHGLL
ncbi:putative DNA repair protein [Escherichia coli]|nr:putative DNA repair protein [Escherichia coli]